MKDIPFINGFSKWDKKQKVALVAELTGESTAKIQSYNWGSKADSEIINSVSENTAAHFGLPFGLAPNFKINNTNYVLPLVTEESSVVAALASAAKFWYTRGGFKTKVLRTIKKGQVHFFWQGKIDLLGKVFPEFLKIAQSETDNITQNMRQRGGGILAIRLLNKTTDIPGYYQLDVDFDTQDAMGANFINSVLEKLGHVFQNFLKNEFPSEKEPEILMAILSNYTPDCLVEVSVECAYDELNGFVKNMSGSEFAHRFCKAIHISNVDVSRAVTHNKGIFNGIDSLAIATGNDWRAIEAAGHAYACRNGAYSGLSEINIEDEKFCFTIKMPMNVGTVGGTTSIHPLAKLSLKLLQNPSAKELMGLFAAAGLASNFSAISALIGKGIQQGHMKLHLKNILTQLEATPAQKRMAEDYFKGKTVVYSEVEIFIKNS